MPTIKDDTLNVEQGIISGAAGNDTFILAAPLVYDNANIIISDTDGISTLHLIAGLSITSAQVASNTLRLKLSNNAEVTVLDVSNFRFHTGGNPYDPNSNPPELNYLEFLEATFGVGLPASGLIETDGATITEPASGGTPPVSDLNGTNDHDNITGTAAGEVISGLDGDDVIRGEGGNDELYGGAGNDVLRGGSGVDAVYGGDGDDRIVVVGDLSGGGKIDSDEDTAVLGFPLTDLNGKDLNEDESGAAETIDGGDGSDTLYVFGTADLTNSTVTGIEKVEIRSDVTFSKAFFDQNVVSSINGDGSSTLRIESDQPITLDMTASDAMTLSGIGHIDLGENVTVKLDSLDDLGGARVLSGKGAIKASGNQGLMNLSGFTVTSELALTNADGSAATGANQMDNVIHGTTGTAGNDYLIGSEASETMNPGAGNDLISGKGGDDTFNIDSAGNKTILDTSGVDTLDLSGATVAANIDLSEGGTLGTSTITLGTGSESSGKQPLDIFLLNDMSYSFNDDVYVVRELAGDLVSSIKASQPDTSFGLGSYVDKPGDWFGSRYGDYVYKTLNPITSDSGRFIDALDLLEVKSGGDSREAQLEALYQVALRTIEDDKSSGTAADELGFRPGALRTVVLTTDADYHRAGDNASAGPNNGDTVLDGDPPGMGEDYPTVSAVKDALVKANIVPIFAVTSYSKGEYQDLADQLGRGAVVDLTPDSSNLISSIQEGLETIKLDFIENVRGTPLSDTLTGNSLDNLIEGHNGIDTLKGLSGDDTLDGGDNLDTAVFRGDREDYTLTEQSDGSYTLQDSVAGRDGQDSLINIEKLQFADQTIDLTAASYQALQVGDLHFSGRNQGLFGDSGSTTVKFDLFNKELKLSDFLTADQLSSHIDLIDVNPTLNTWFTDVELGSYEADFDYTLAADTSVTLSFPVQYSINTGSFDIDYVFDDVFFKLPEGGVEAGASFTVNTGYKNSSGAKEIVTASSELSVDDNIAFDLDAGLLLDWNIGASANLEYAYSFLGSDDVTTRQHDLMDFADSGSIADTADDRYDAIQHSFDSSTGMHTISLDSTTMADYTQSPGYFGVVDFSLGETASELKSGLYELLAGKTNNLFKDGRVDLVELIEDATPKSIKDVVGSFQASVDTNNLKLFGEGFEGDNTTMTADTSMYKLVSTHTPENAAVELGVDIDDLAGAILQKVKNPYVMLAGKVFEYLDGDFNGGLTVPLTGDKSLFTEFDMNYSLFGMDLKLDLSPSTRVSFSPDDVLLTLTPSWDASAAQSGSLGDDFVFTAPDAEGEHTVVANYTLKGGMALELGLQSENYINLSALGVDGSLALGVQEDGTPVDSLTWSAALNEAEDGSADGHYVLKDERFLENDATLYPDAFSFDLGVKEISQEMVYTLIV